MLLPEFLPYVGWPCVFFEIHWLESLLQGRNFSTLSQYQEQNWEPIQVLGDHKTQGFNFPTVMYLGVISPLFHG